MPRLAALTAFLACTLLSLVQAGEEAGNIRTIAGTGTRGYSGDGAAATKAQLNEPFGVELDGKGNLLVAEAGNHCIRKIELKGGKISTIAGTGKKGYAGDGAAARKATFHEPYAVVVDGDGNLYVADRLNAVVRKIDGKSGVVSTVAGDGEKGSRGDGMPGTRASLIEPNDLCVWKKRFLLIADVAAWNVRVLDLKTGLINTFAGTGKPEGAAKGFPRAKIGDGGVPTEAVIVGARAVAADGAKGVYICEREGSSIRKVDGEGVISTFAGTGEWGDSGDGGQAAKAVFRGPKGVRCDRAGNVYVVDCENHAIRKIDAKTGVISTVAGGKKGSGGDGGPATRAGLDRPHGCVVDGEGNLYIADTNNHRIRCVKLP